jgi:hypothetical protein
MERRSAIPGVTESRGFALLHGKGCLQARVGIAQVRLLFQNSPKPFGSGYFSKCCTGKEFIKVVCWNQAKCFLLTPANFCQSEHF